MQRILQILIAILVLIVFVLMCSIFYGFYHKPIILTGAEEKVALPSGKTDVSQVGNGVELEIKGKAEDDSTSGMVSLSKEQAIKECIVSTEMKLAAVRYRISKNGQVSVQDVAAAAEKRAHELIGRPEFYIESNIEFYAVNYASLFASNVSLDQLSAVEINVNNEVQECKVQAKAGFTMKPIYNWTVFESNKNSINTIKE